MEQQSNELIQQFNEQTPLEPIKKSRKIWWILGISIGVVLILGGIYWWQRDFINNKIGDLFGKEDVEEVIPTPSITWKSASPTIDDIDSINSIFNPNINHWEDIYGVEIDTLDNIYVSVPRFGYIRKFSSDGKFLIQWGGFGNGNGKFNSGSIIAIDSNNIIYATDRGNHRIQKFNSDGLFLNQWNSEVLKISTTTDIKAIAVGYNNDVFISFNDSSSKPTVIKRYTSDGNLKSSFEIRYDYLGIGMINGVKQWKKEIPKSIEVRDIDTDSLGNIYVFARISRNNNEALAIQKFNPSGDFIDQIYDVGWYCRDVVINKHDYNNIYTIRQGYLQKINQDGMGFGGWQLKGLSTDYIPARIVSDRNGNVYISFSGSISNIVQKFNSEGKLLAEFKPNIIDSGPDKIAMDYEKNIYATYYGSDFDSELKQNKLIAKIKKFDSSGSILKEFKFNGSGGSFYDIAVDSKKNMYVIDEGEVLKIDFNGNEVKRWGGFGFEGGEAYLDIDSKDNIYVLNHRGPNVEKFNSNGNLIKSWKIPTGSINIFIDSLDNVYILSFNNINKYDSNGNEISQLDIKSENMGGFSMDSEGNFYITQYYSPSDFKISNVQKFSSKGEFLSKIGSYGINNGQYLAPTDIIIDNSNMYIADPYNHRIQKFSPVR